MLDKVLLEVLANRFTGVVEEMGYVIHRAAFTTFVKETWDFDSALVTTDGNVFAYPRSIGVTNMLSMSMKAAIGCFDHYEPGDVVLTNDPNHARGMSTHLPDLMMFKPIFAEGRVVCFAWCFVHSSDVGGIVPGSITPYATDRFQEGLAIPPIKLYRAGVLNEELKRLVLANCRIPEQNWGDINALTAALGTAEKRVAECIERYGVASIEQVIEGLLDYSEARARKVFEDVPDGRYEFSDYLEGDLLKTHNVRIKLAMTVSGSDVHLDFTGTDPQVNAAFNLPTHGMLNHFVVLGIVNYLRTADAGIPFNRGMVRPVRVTLPEGSLLNPTQHAPTGIRYATALRVSDVVMGALSQAVPSRIPAAGSGQFGLLTLSDLDPTSGDFIVHVLQPLQGGSGGRPGKDGIDGVNFSGGALRNAPIEALELDAPIFVRQYELNNAAAPGQWRGGSGIVFSFQLLSPHAQVTSRGWDRFHINPWGRLGGAGGTLGGTHVTDVTGKEQPIPKIEVLRLAPGEIVRIVSPGGGGYGPACDREPAHVLRDVENGFVTVEEASEQYGVMITEGLTIDYPATLLRRRTMTRQPSTDFEYGIGRINYEKAIPEVFQDLVVELSAAAPPASRLHIRDIIYERLLESGPASLDVEAVKRIIAEVMTPPAPTFVVSAPESPDTTVSLAS